MYTHPLYLATVIRNDISQFNCLSCDLFTTKAMCRKTSCVTVSCNCILYMCIMYLALFPISSRRFINTVFAIEVLSLFLYHLHLHFCILKLLPLRFTAVICGELSAMWKPRWKKGIRNALRSSQVPLFPLTKIYGFPVGQLLVG